MARDSKSFEKVEIADSYGLSESQKRRQEVVRDADLEIGQYLVLPQLNFAAKTTYNGEVFNSPRIIVVKMDGDTVECVRSFKVSNLTAQMTFLKDAEIPKDIECRLNEDGMRRLPAHTGNVMACRDFIPKAVVKVDGEDRLEITEPFIMDYKGILQGYMPNYKPEKKGKVVKYNIELDDEDNVVWVETSIPNFSVVGEAPSKSQIKAAIDAVNADSQFKAIYAKCVRK